MRWCMHNIGTEPHAEKRTNIVRINNPPIPVAAIVVNGYGRGRPLAWLRELCGKRFDVRALWSVSLRDD